ncbi:MAG TPA: HD domain-containing protein [Acidimicrobiales bacterium]|jgi:putative nucleotidyltransferase with HDIG domain|nr:HD domain-containing protein [Acidimicrobiales bacterium]
MTDRATTDAATERLIRLRAKVEQDIPAIADFDDADLRRAITDTWAASLAASPYDDLRDVPQSPVIVNRPLYLHVNEVNDLARTFIDFAVSLRLAIDHDVTLAAAILHDVDKPLIYRRAGEDKLGYADGTRLSDHGPLGADLALRHGVPGAIADLVRVHSPFASTGLPETAEGTALHYADVLANDMAAVQFGSPTIHCGFTLVPKSPHVTGGIDLAKP